jgi:hypothetical protein
MVEIEFERMGYRLCQGVSRRELAISTSATGCCQQYGPLLDIQVPGS